MSVHVRPWQDGDAVLLRRAATQLSPRSLWERFGVGTHTLPGPYLRMLDEGPAKAGGPAVVVALHDGQVIGWAEAQPLGAGEVEVAAVVVDAWQGRGVGRRLARELLADPAVAGRTPHAYVQPANAAAIRLVKAAAPGELEASLSDGYLHYTC